MDYSLLLSSIENVLGKGHKRARNNYAFYCPFCNHKKLKLEVQMVTTEKGENPWECWVCHTRGRSIHSLLKQLNIPLEQAQPILSLVKKGNKSYYQVEEVLTLPKEFQSLWNASSESIIANKVRKYLYSRGLTDLEIRKYNIGYCTSGDYQGRMIIPSYDENNKLNFFVARTYENSFYKYKNPSTSKDIIFFENTINWNLPVVLVEGVFDALAVKRNVIPLLGTTLSKSLIKKLTSNKVEKVYLALDNDALKHTIGITEKLLSMGKKVFVVDVEGKDPSIMGFLPITQKINQAQEIDISDLIKMKIAL